ncbi:hypothetical protein [Methanoregula sp.]|uniref:hypothetical protein n=1 Tax=Methanoregula sp. TaxID=2052170 RepID=UPI002BBBC0FC|nr:hypothetical protein [Methanoregula sp.]HVP95531.1 hypothetical protein [Methanoregula sp.]
MSFPSKRWIETYFIAVIIFMIGAIIVETPPIDGIRNILNAYITINLAIIAVAFAAMGINPNFKESKSKSILKISLASSFSLFACLFSYFVSYGSLTTMVTNTVLFGASTALTVFSISLVISLIFDYMPENSLQLQ